MFYYYLSDVLSLVELFQHGIGSSQRIFIKISDHHITHIYQTKMQYSIDNNLMDSQYLGHLSSFIILRGVKITIKHVPLLYFVSPSVRLSVRSHFRNRYLSFYWKK
jgi:hypothetical protein